MPILPAAAPDGEARRDAALALLRRRRAALVRDLTRAVAGLALERDELTADDVRAVVPIPPGIRPVVVGAAVWRLADADAARAWLATHPPLTTAD